jgi:ATP-dependent Lhr-like helicase
VLQALAGGGAYFFRPLSDAVGSTDDEEMARVLWDLVWAGRLTGDTLAPLRARLAGGRTAHRPGRSGPRSSRYAARPGRARTGLQPGRAALPTRTGPPTTAGRWSALPDREPDPTIRAAALAETLLDRHGVLTRGAVVGEGVVGGFAAVYRVLSAFEDAGRVRRGYFVEGLGAAQFSTAGAVDRLRSVGERASSALVVAAADPANPFGAALPWPERATVAPGATQHKPARKAGALVVMNDGELSLYVERGGKSLLSFTDDTDLLAAAADALALAVREGALGRLTVERADGAGLLGSDHPLVAALSAAGFHTTPRGLRLRA